MCGMNQYKNICISVGNYKSLKKMGQAGDSFNDVLTKLLEFKDRKDLDNFEVGLKKI
jgi:predicted CopG family antitoxin